MSKKILGIFSLIMINVIAVDSLRSLPFSATYGFSLVFYYLLAAVLFFYPVSLVVTELATTWPDKGGIYVWVREAFGERWGFLVIWLQWVYNIAWYPTILSLLSATFAFLINPHLADNNVYMLTTILITFWLATYLNWHGMQLSSLVSAFSAMIGTLIPMFFIIILGAVWLLEGRPSHIEFTTHSFWPNLSSINNLTFLIAVLFGLVGMELAASHADEVRNPGKSFPVAIAISSVVILVSLILSSLAIAIVVPQQQLNVVTGLIQAFMVFFNAYHLHWMQPIITLLIIIGGLGGVAAWVIGPTKGLLVATKDGNIPPILAKINKKEVPTVILFAQAVIVTLLCTVFLLMPTVSSSFWVLTAITAELALLVYIIMFAAAIHLRYKKPKITRPYKIPGGNIGMWIVGIMGIVSCVFAFIIGFFPPSQITVGKILRYEIILISGLLILCIPPFILYAIRKPHWRLNSH